MTGRPSYNFFVLILAVFLAAAAPVTFDREVRPILAANCYQCHGPDGESRKGDLRLDVEAEARPVLKEVLARITHADPDERMPPVKSGKKLSATEIATLRRWIEQGAKWEQHWSLKPLRRPVAPKLPSPQADWARNPIDLFIRAKHSEIGVAPSAEADNRTLIRRMTFDLTGLPPMPAEIAAFNKAADADRDQAIVALADRLLASPRYGERWGRHWLDVVKYADTCGYDKDKLRPNAWPYRDYVIRSFNENKPYARFVQEQIAGDTLFPGTADGILGLGFIAAGPWDFIGHVEVSESKIDGRVARHIDRDEMVSNTLNTFTSATIQCARCHDHKFDPYTQKHYYSLQSVFAAVDRANRPYTATPELAKRKAVLTARVADYKKQLAALDAEMKKEGGAAMVALDKKIAALRPKAKLKSKRPEFGYHSLIVKNPRTVKWVQVDLGATRGVKQVVLRACHDEYAGIGGGFGFPVRFKVEGAATADFKSPVMLVDQTQADFPNPNIAPVAFVVDAKVRFLRVTATVLAERKNDYMLALAELEARSATGQNVAAKAKVTSPDSIQAPPRWRRTNLTDGHFPIAVDATAIAALQAAQSERTVLLAKLQTPERKAKRQKLQTDLSNAEAELKKIPAGQMVYAAATQFKTQGNFKPTGGKPREIKVLHRGNILQPRDAVRPGTLPIFAKENFEFNLPANHPETARRAALAQWITRADNPLTWRSIVNRIWLWHFGQGIVETPNDFGRMGLPPSHPELLDWLAVEFRDSGGRFKHLHKLIVTSSTYRQASLGDKNFEKIDANNRTLWRMNRRRLEAEELRDAILATSGALNETPGGPGYYLFVLEKTAHSPHYEYYKFNPADPKSHRRSVYRFIVRSQPDPFMTTLDCADSSQSTPKRDETLTALQALSLLNNKFTLHMAGQFAERIKKESKTLKGQIRRAHQLITGRPPTVKEVASLHAYAQKHGLPNLCRVLFNLSEFTYVD
ncbi:MAG: cytochrome C [Verrucomicrobiales bacterium]|nr:cytochrome C [Verrucomicrobiales bacterium]